MACCKTQLEKMQKALFFKRMYFPIKLVSSWNFRSGMKHLILLHLLYSHPRTCELPVSSLNQSNTNANSTSSWCPAPYYICTYFEKQEL